MLFFFVWSRDGSLSKKVSTCRLCSLCRYTVASIVYACVRDADGCTLCPVPFPVLTPKPNPQPNTTPHYTRYTSLGRKTLAGSLERIIAQVDMEESGGSGARQEHARLPPGSSTGGYAGSTGGGTGAGGGGGGAGATTGSGGGWTDMFQGMTVEVRTRAGCADVIWEVRLDPGSPPCITACAGMVAKTPRVFHCLVELEWGRENIVALPCAS